MNVTTDAPPVPPTVSPALSRRDALAALAGTLASAAAFGFSRPATAQQGDPKKEVVQTAKFKIGEGREEEAMTMLRGLAAKVEELEPGVLTYLVYRPANDATTVFFFEIYADEAALAAHGQQPHLVELRGAFQSGLFAPPVEIVRLDAIGGFAR
jgi:quinol monooxygenase YgiN